MHDSDLSLDLRTPSAATVELAVDDSERQLLTPVLRYFLARGYTAEQGGVSNEIRLDSGADCVIVRSDLDDRGVVLSIAASAFDPMELRAAVASAITGQGGLLVEGDGPCAEQWRFNDRYGVARAVLRAPTR